MNLFSSQLAQPPLPLPPSWFPLLPPDPLLQQQKCAQSARRIARYSQSCNGNLELHLIVEELQELRSMRIQKLKRQGHFLPEEDNKFIERVQVAIEEEERQALVSANTDAAREAIVSAEESRKSIQNQGDSLKGSSKEQKTEGEDEKGSVAVEEKEFSKMGSEGQSSRGAYDDVANLPIEFYHYYHGSNNDMGTLIEEF